jgi:sec-independent protein translocase protein TatC
MGFNTEKLMAMLSINAYIGFILKIIIAFGVVFELPIFSFILTKAGILTHTFLIKKFKYAVVVMFIVAAIITPPDVLTQFMMAIPLLLLYGISIIIALLAGKKND